MSCAEYGKSQGIDPLDAAMTVGYRSHYAIGVVNDLDVLTTGLFLALILAALLLAKSNQWSTLRRRWRRQQRVTGRGDRCSTF